MEKNKIGKLSLLLIPLAVVIVALAVWGPEALAKYQDRAILDRVNVQEAGKGMEGYRYSLSGREKLYILSKSLSSQALPESELNALTRPESGSPDYQEITGTYAFVVNRKDPSGQEVSADQGIHLCSRGMEELKSLGILPKEVAELKETSYSAVQYCAIDVPEPRNQVLVWKISLRAATNNAGRGNCLLDAYVDADTGKIYEFYARTELTSWSQVDADGMIRAWAGYMGLDEPEAYENANPLAETTPYFKKYSFTGMEEGSTIVTIGFYEGINELFLKISR